jgi:glycosyltransferase involved in cell wall biosynthesis
MRILHVGFGYTPLRAGGLIEYAEDLMAAQVANGDNVGFFTAGRRYPWFRRPRLWRSKRKGVQYFELINSPLVIDEFGSKDPALDMHERDSERILREVIAEFKPEMIHIQELASLPSSVLEIAHESGVATVMTLQDYLPLCPTFRLYDYRGEVCLQREVGHKCVPCCATLSGSPGLVMKMTAIYEASRLLSPKLAAQLWRAKDAVKPLARALRGGRSPEPAPLSSPAPENAGDPAAAHQFQKRREVAASRLGKVDVLVAQSTRVAEIYRTLGVTSERLQTLHLTVNHLSAIHFKRRTATPSPVTFVTLGGCGTIAKGALLLSRAVELLAPSVPPDSFRLLVFGGLLPDVQTLLRLPQVDYRGVYGREQLDQILGEADVGIIPSVWEEAYGYTGVEMLAKGLPVIGNRIGGIVDYVIPGMTGWLNSTKTAEELAAIMRNIIENPEQVVTLNRAIEQSRSSIVKTMETHRDEIEQVYRQARKWRETGAGAMTPATSSIPRSAPSGR